MKNKLILTCAISIFSLNTANATNIQSTPTKSDGHSFSTEFLAIVMTSNEEADKKTLGAFISKHSDQLPENLKNIGDDIAGYYNKLSNHFTSGIVQVTPVKSSNPHVESAFANYHELVKLKQEKKNTEKKLATIQDSLSADEKQLKEIETKLSEANKSSKSQVQLIKTFNNQKSSLLEAIKTRNNKISELKKQIKNLELAIDGKKMDTETSTITSSSSSEDTTPQAPEPRTRKRPVNSMKKTN